MPPSSHFSPVGPAGRRFLVCVLIISKYNYHKMDDAKKHASPISHKITDSQKYSLWTGIEPSQHFEVVLG